MQKIYIWDWDNTLCDTMPVVEASYNKLLVAHDRKPCTTAEIKKLMNGTGRQIIAALFPKDDTEALFAEFAIYYTEMIKNASLKERAADILKKIIDDGGCNIIASNKDGDQLRAEAAFHHIEKYFTRIIGAGDLPFNKPSFEYAALLKKECFPVCSEIYMIGDGASDMKLGKALGAKNILAFSDPLSDEFASLHIDIAVSDFSRLYDVLFGN